MKQHNLEAIIQRIQHKWGYSAIQRAAHINIPIATLPTGFVALDEMIGGLPISHITEISGTPTVGLSTLTYFLIASAQARGEHVVLLDLDNSFDAAMGAQFGVKVNDLLLVEAADALNLLEVLRGIVRSGVVGLVVVNLLHLRSRSLDVRRLMSELRSVRCAVVLLMPGYAKSNGASLRLRLQRREWLSVSGDIVGCLTDVTVERSRLSRAGESVTLLMPLDREAWS